MDNKTLQQEQLIERYILNKMTDQEATAFEIDYLADQECLDQLEMAQKLYQGLGAVAASSHDQSPESASNQSAEQNKPWWQKTVPLWAMAALFLIMLIPLNMRPNTSTQTAFNRLNVINLPMSQLRGAESQTITITASDQQVILTLYLEPDLYSDTYSSYSFSLSSKAARDSDNQAILEFHDMTINADDMLYIDLGKNTLAAGPYTFSIYGNTNTGGQTKINQGSLAVVN